MTTEAPEAVRLAEFASLRAEVAQRATFQQALIALNLTAVGTIAGFVLSDRAPRALLLVIPLFAPTLGILWLDHDRKIGAIATYIRDELWTWTPSWHAHLASVRTPAAAAARFWGAVFMMFFAISAGALALGLPDADASAGEWVLWVAGLLLTLAYASAFARSIADWRRRRAAAGAS